MKINFSSNEFFIQTKVISIRFMEDNMDDYQLIAKWLTDEKVLEFYEGRDNPYPLQRIIEKYSPKVLAEEKITPCIFIYQNNPIGYLQYYALEDLPQTDKQKYHLENTNNVYGIDLLIGETEYWNQGIGTKVISAIVNYLFEQLNAVKIVIDPEAGNTRAIRCYEKSGFKKVKLLPKHEVHEGEYRNCWLMAQPRHK